MQYQVVLVLVPRNYFLNGSLAQVRNHHTATSLPNGAVLFAGGYLTGGSFVLDSAELASQ